MVYFFALFSFILLCASVTVARADDLTSEQKKLALRQCSALEKPVNYLVEKDDYLTGILQTFGFKPLYGKMSRVTEVSEINEIKDPNIILPGQELYLPFRCEQDTERYVLIDRGEDRQINSKYLIKVKTRILSDGRRVNLMRLPNSNGKWVPYDASVFLSSGQGDLEKNELPPDHQKIQLSLGTIQVKYIDKPFKKHSTLSVGGLYGFQRINSVGSNNGSTALLLSKPVVGLHLGWDLHWTSRWTTSFNFAHRQVEMESASVGVLTNEKQNTSALGAHIQYHWTDKFRSMLGVNYEDRLFVRSTQIGNASLEVFQQPIVDLKIEHQLFQYGSLGMDLMLGYRQMLNTSSDFAKIENSGEYLMGTTFRRQIKQMQIAIQLNYLKGKLKSNLTEQDNSAVEAWVGIKMEIGK
jgi:hypothetical protein